MMNNKCDDIATGEEEKMARVKLCQRVACYENINAIIAPFVQNDFLLG